MAQDFDRALGQLRDMLSTEEGQRQLEGIIGSVQGGMGGMGGEQPHEVSGTPAQRPNTGAFGMDVFMKIKNIMDTMQMDNDPRVNVLSSLRPYINANRGHHLDSAIKIMSLGKLPIILKNMKK